MNLRLPAIQGTEREQLAQIKSYLYQIIPELNMQLERLPLSSPSATLPDEEEKIYPADFVIEEQTLEGWWTYRKWHSGLSECWVVKTCEVSINTQRAFMYESDSPVYENFPSGLFKTAPLVSITAQANDGDGGVIIATRGNTTNGYTCDIYPTSANKRTVNLSIAIKAIGRWK